MARAMSETRPGPPSATPQQADKAPLSLISSEVALLSSGQYPVVMLAMAVSVSPGPPGFSKVGQGSELPPALPYVGGFPPLLLEAHTLAPCRRERWPSWACLQNLPPVCWASIRAGRAGVELQGSCTRPGPRGFPVASRTQWSQLGAPPASLQGPSEARNPAREQNGSVGRRGSG